jgi:hypothetical protein
MKKLAREFAAFAEPGALIAMFLVLLMMGAGSAAIIIAARGPLFLVWLLLENQLPAAAGHPDCSAACPRG